MSTERMNFRSRTSRTPRPSEWFHGLILGLILVVLVIIISHLGGCSTSTTNPDGTVTQDSTSVALGKRAKQAVLLLDTATGSIDGLVATGDMTQDKATELKGYISLARSALSTVVDSQSGEVFACFVAGNCTDAQNQAAAEGIGKAIVLIAKLGDLTKKPQA